jgi:hypothetical protein
MATEKKGVMVYLPRDVEEVLEKYCTENNITRKNKDGESMPSMGTGIVQYLKSQLLGIAPSNPSAPTLTRDDVLELIKESVTRIAPSAGLSEDEARSIVESAIEQAIAPIRESLSSARVGTYTDLTADGVQTAIEQAIEPIQSDLAELLLRIDRLEASRTSENVEKSTSHGSRTGKRPSTPLPGDPNGATGWFRADPEFFAAAKKQIAAGGTNADIGDRLLKAGFSNDKGANFDTGEISRFRKAIAYLDSESHG